MQDVFRDLGALALGSRLKRLSDRLINSVSEIYVARGIDFEPRWLPLYRYVSLHPNSSVGEAAQALGLTHASVSQMVTSMKRGGVIVTRKSREDERRTVLALSKKGAALASTMTDTWRDVESGLNELIKTTGVDLLATLDRIEEQLDKSNLENRVAICGRRARLKIVDFDPTLRHHFARLNVEWLEAYFAIEPIDREVLWHPEKNILDPGGAIWFAILDDEVVGTCALQRISQSDVELTRMAVTEVHRGVGIGKRLLTQALERAQELGFRRIELVTNTCLHRAITLYEHMGFVVTRTGAHPKYARGNLTMSKTL